MERQWKLTESINDCVNVENSIKYIKEISQSIEKYNTQQY